MRGHLLKLALPVVAMLTQTSIAAAAPARISPPVDRVENADTYELKPQIGQIASAEVGDPLYWEGTKTVSTTYRAKLAKTVRKELERGYVLAVSQNTSGPMLMRPDSKIPLLCFQTSKTGIVGFFGDNNVIACLVDKNKDQVFTHAMFPQYDRYFALDEPVPYTTEKTERILESQDSFHVDVIYQGISKGEVKLSYREFSGGLARPAFTQDVTYELAKDGPTSIGFKGMRVKILKATNEGLEYIVEQPMPSMARLRPAAQP